jgi:hypothetical protein
MSAQKISQSDLSGIVSDPGVLDLKLMEITHSGSGIGLIGKMIILQVWGPDHLDGNKKNCRKQKKLPSRIALQTVYFKLNLNLNFNTAR